MLLFLCCFPRKTFTCWPVKLTLLDEREKNSFMSSFASIQLTFIGFMEDEEEENYFHDSSMMAWENVYEVNVAC